MKQLNQNYISNRLERINQSLKGEPRVCVCVG